ncbi:MAG: hypothetical protein EBX41_05825, partial [Chitinophagia bacterium]|nr:hypothetical protein [Chitinophagia bacterium]
MKKHFLLLPFIAGLLYLALSSNSGGPGASSSVNGTGARGTTGCSCHSSAADTGIRVTLTLDSAGTPVTRYIAGRSYNITITGTNNSSSTLRGFGFQFTAVNLTGAGTSSATNAGTLATTGLPTACQNTSVSGLRLIEHSARITATSGSGGTGTTYRTSVQWTAPSAGTGSIRLYGVLQAVDASGSTTGDKWNNVMVTIGELSSSGAGTISGPTAVCVNSQITLTDSVGGGTWSSSNASIATVGATTGVVTGVGRGSVIISYGGSAMGYATTTITVNPIPSVITGSDVICVGSTATYLDSTTGGSWAISPTSVATVAGGTLTATVTAVSAGTATLSYTLSTGCSRSRAVTINPLPGTITGPNHLCAGSTANYTDTSTGITWSCSPSSVATINSSGMVTGVTAGSATIT